MVEVEVGFVNMHEEERFHCLTQGKNELRRGESVCDN